MNGALQTNPLERWLPAFRHLSFLDQANRLKHVCNVIKSPNFGFQSLIVQLFTIRDFSGSLLKRNYLFPRHEEDYELLTKMAQRFYFLVLLRPLELSEPASPGGLRGLVLRIELNFI